MWRQLDNVLQHADHSLGRHLQSHADLVAGLVELGAIKESGYGHGDAGSQALLVAQTNLNNINKS